MVQLAHSVGVRLNLRNFFLICQDLIEFTTNVTRILRARRSNFFKVSLLLAPPTTTPTGEPSWPAPLTTASGRAFQHNNPHGAGGDFDTTTTHRTRLYHELTIGRRPEARKQPIDTHFSTPANESSTLPERRSYHANPFPDD